ncbi:MAG: hypothetical protein Q9M40_07100 [Sulfurimonas sp.]|nr:hypothetical protein [Sulfurimonas sp.]MDQ7067741.1 hypothetical protein [Sulfurimonas sp.]
MMKNKKNNIASVALTKSRELETLIAVLNSTTIGSLVADISGLKNKDIVYADALSDIATALSLIDTKITTLSNTLGITFNADGTLAQDNYTTHTHNYSDKTISDTVDATGVVTDETRQTQGIN